MAHAPYVPLRNLSAYSLLEGAIAPKQLAAQAKTLGFPAAALTDRNGLYAVMAYSEAAAKSGIQPIIGTTLAIARPDRPDNAPLMLDWLVLLAQDDIGYTNLCALVSQAHVERPMEDNAHVGFAALEAHAAGLICLTASGDGALARLVAEGQPDAADAYLDRLQAIFGDRLYIELSRTGDPVMEQAEEALIDLAYARDLPLVATNPACYADPAFHAAHDVLLCIASGSYVESSERPRSSPESWMKPAEDMAALFADLPEAIANTLVVAQRCAVMAPKRKPILPSLAGDKAGEETQLRADATAGLVERLRKLTALQTSVRPEPVEGPPFSSNGAGEEGRGFDKLSPNGDKGGGLDEASLRARYPDYFDRLDFELDVIIQMGFPGYFLIVADFIKWAKAQDIPVGPGRGSGAGSVVAWSLTITDLDPLQLGLLFERFLNPERVSMPDFDIDFCETRRGEVIKYVQDKYGRDHVAQIITFGTLKARAALKDTGRVLQMGYNQVDRLAKLIPNHPTDPWTLARTMNGSVEFLAEYKADSGIRRLVDQAMQIEGLPRNSSTHAAGVVIGDRPLSELVPLYRDPKSDMPVTQFDLKYVETAGLVKFDFLGLKTLSVLQRAVQMLKARGVEIDLSALRWDDEETYRLLQRGDTVGVFQVESEGMRKTLAAVKPTVFEDIIALGALYRPGPMDNIPMFGRRKNGVEEIEYPHILLEPILKETYGIFVYQEQVMQAAQILAGYSLGGADLLRRAMGKKIKAEMDAQRAAFVEGCKTHAIERKKANELFDLIDKFAGYGFNKSHAAAYALLTYQTAYLKAHYPAEFYAASMAFDIHQTDKLCVFVDDLRRFGITCLPPDINVSRADFSVEPDPADPTRHAVRYALGGLKGVGEKAMETLVDERIRGGPFRDLDDLADRIEPRLLNRRQVESLAAGGAFDSIGIDRAVVHAAAETLLSVAAKAAEARETGQHGLFGGDEVAHADVPLPTSAKWTGVERMAQEKEAFGFYFSAHPVDRYRQFARARGVRSYAELCGASDGLREGERNGAMMAALIEEIRWRDTRKGARFISATFSDSSGQFQASCFDGEGCDLLARLYESNECALLTVELDKQPSEETPRVTVRGVQAFEKLAGSARMRMVIAVEREEAVAPLAAMLADRHGGRSRVEIEAVLPDGGRATVLLGDDFQLDEELGERIEAIRGVTGVALGPLGRPDLRVVASG